MEAVIAFPADVEWRAVMVDVLLRLPACFPGEGAGNRMCP